MQMSRSSWLNTDNNEFPGWGGVETCSAQIWRLLSTLVILDSDIQYQVPRVGDLWVTTKFIVSPAVAGTSGKVLTREVRYCQYLLYHMASCDI